MLNVTIFIRHVRNCLMGATLMARTPQASASDQSLHCLIIESEMEMPHLKFEMDKGSWALRL